MDSALDPKFHVFLYKCLCFWSSMHSYLLIAHRVSLPHSHLLPEAPLSLSSQVCRAFSFVTLCQPSWSLHSVGHVMVTYKSYTILSFLYIFTGLVASLICWIPIVPRTFALAALYLQTFSRCHTSSLPFFSPLFKQHISKQDPLDKPTWSCNSYHFLLKKFINAYLLYKAMGFIMRVVLF